MAGGVLRQSRIRTNRKTEVTNLFDHYDLRARLQPALLTLVPIFYAVAVCAPDLYSIGRALLALFLACGVLLLFAHLCRAGGKQVEVRLFSSDGVLVLPSARWLRHDDSHLEPLSKIRYRRILEEQVPDLVLPSEQEEQADSTSANRAYMAASRWLTQRTRDRTKFALLYKELVNYGFRRNLLGARTWGVFFCVVALAISGGSILRQPNIAEAFNQIGPISSAVLAIISLAVWAQYINDAFVISVSESYAKELLSACDEIDRESVSARG